MDFKVGDRVRGADPLSRPVEGVVQHVGHVWLKLVGAASVKIESASLVEAKAIVPAQKVEVTLLMGADEARDIVGKIREAMDNSRAWLAELHEREGWKALGYKSWRECVVAEFGQSQAYLYRQLAAAQTEKLISPDGEVGQIPEAHLRPLSKLPQVERAEAWQEAVESAPEGKMTGAHVRKVVDRRQLQIFRDTYAKQELEKVAPGSKDAVFEVLPTPLAFKVSGYLGSVRVASPPPEQPWSLESRFVSLMGCPELDLWIEVALATVEKASAEECPIRIVLWLPALVDQDWFRRLACSPVCFVSATYLERSAGLKLKQPAALAVLMSRQVNFVEERDRFAEELREVGYVWS